MKLFRTFFPTIIEEALFSFCPWLAVCLALGASLFSLSKQRFALEWIVFSHYFCSFVLAIVLQRPDLLMYDSCASSLLCSCCAFGSLLISRPLTLPYARSRVPKHAVQSSLFFQVNQAITFCMGCFFGLESAIKVMRIFEISLQYTVIQSALGVVFTLFIKYFPSWYSRRLKKSTP